MTSLDLERGIDIKIAWELGCIVGKSPLGLSQALVLAELSLPLKKWKKES